MPAVPNRTFPSNKKKGGHLFGFISFPIPGLGKSSHLLYQMNEYSQRCVLGMFWECSHACLGFLEPLSPWERGGQSLGRRGLLRFGQLKDNVWDACLTSVGLLEALRMNMKTQCRGDKWQDVGQGSSSWLVTFIFPLSTVKIIIIKKNYWNITHIS